MNPEEWIGWIVLYLLVGLGVAWNSMHIRRAKAETFFAAWFFPNRAILGWRNDSNEDRYRTPVDRAYGGREEPSLSLRSYYAFSMATWSIRLVVNVCILAWVLLKTLLIYVTYAPPQANYELRQRFDMKRAGG